MKAYARHGPAAAGATWAPLVVGLATLAGACACQLARVLAATGGEFAYPLDDAYIHLAMARQLADAGVWGVTPHEFASASSSPLWLVLLAVLHGLSGNASWPPALLAGLSSGALVVVVDRWWRRRGVAAWSRTLGLVLLVFAAALPTLVLSGMEHCMHALLAVLFAERITAAVDEEAPAPGALASAVGLAPLLVGARFESLFLVAPAGLLLWRRRGAGAMLLLGAAAALPVVALGLWSLAQGHFVLPNSVLLKGGDAPIPGLTAAARGLSAGIQALVQRGHTGALLLLVVFAWWRTRSGRRGERAGSLLAAAALLLHAQFARFGWYYRYESYLIVLGCAVSAPAVATSMLDARPAHRWAGRLLLLFVVAAFAGRSLRAWHDPPRASRHTLLQNVQVGRFLATLPGERRVAVNDVGAVCWLADLRLVDLVGLADIEVAQARRTGTFDAAFLAALTARRRTRFAVVYEHWFHGQLPAHWQRVATWTVEDPYWTPTVVFFGTDAGAAADLRGALAAFAARLPRGVLVE